MHNIEKLDYIWRRIRDDGEVRISWEAALHIMRTLAYANITTPGPERPDERQHELPLIGGTSIRRIATIRVF